MMLDPEILKEAIRQHNVMELSETILKVLCYRAKEEGGVFRITREEAEQAHNFATNNHLAIRVSSDDVALWIYYDNALVAEDQMAHD